MIKAYKYRLNPNSGQRKFFEQSFGCCRVVDVGGFGLPDRMKRQVV